MKLSVIIPAYNEEKRIVRTLEKTLDFLAAQDYDSEILVVCDGNTDRTQEVALSYAGRTRVAVQALRYEPNRGKGHAVRYGMLRGSGDILLFMDADYAVPFEEAEKGLRLLAEGYDIAIASRALPDSLVKKKQNFFRGLSSKVYTLIQSLYLGIHYPDTQCGFKLFTRRAARDLFGRQKLDSVIFDPEILWLAKKSGYRVVEFPVEWHHVEDSQIVYDSLRKSLFIFEELFRIRRLHRDPRARP